VWDELRGVLRPPAREKALPGLPGVGRPQAQPLPGLHDQSLRGREGLAYSFECAAFPCPAFKRMDKSYRTHYRVSLIDYGRAIKAEA
jgi:hypothetical protein